MALPATHPVADPVISQRLRVWLVAAPAGADPSHRAPQAPQDITVDAAQRRVYTLEGRPRVLHESTARVLAFVALHGGAVARPEAAGALWPDGDDGRARGNLRSALWRLRGEPAQILSCDRAWLRLAPGVVVDLHELDAWAHRVMSGAPRPDDLRIPDVLPDSFLLPGWYDDWVVFARERFRQRMLHGLEALSRHLAAAGRIGEAVDAAIAAIAWEPLRESAHRVLIEAHLLEHNRVEARRAFDDYARLVHTELGVAPSFELAALVR
jgi:DNA-binding SARP family transcriptional activator